MLKQPNGVPFLTEFIAPAITPYSGNNPSFRIFEYDKRTFQLLDYVQYSTNLTAVNGQTIS